MLQNAVRCLPDSVDDHEHLAEHLEDVCEGQEGDVGVALRAEDVDRERERLQRVEQVPLRQHHALRNTCVCLSVGAGWSNVVQGLVKRWSPGCVNAAGKARQRC